MLRYLAPSAVILALATTAHAQNYVTRSYTTTDGYGNSTTTTIQAPTSVVGLIANQGVYGGFSSYYGNGVSGYGTNCPPNYNYNSGYGYQNGYQNYNTVPSYGYGYQTPYPYYYGGAPQGYYGSGQTTYINNGQQVIINPGYPSCPPGGNIPSLPLPNRTHGVNIPYTGGWSAQTQPGGIPYTSGWSRQNAISGGGTAYSNNGIRVRNR